MINECPKEPAVTQYWNPSESTGAKETGGYWQEHFSQYDPDLTRARYHRISSELRETCPVVHSDAHEDGFWMLTKYADIHRVSTDTANNYSNFPVTIPPFGNPRPMIPIETDPPMHLKYRRIILNYFGKARIDEKEADYREQTVGYISKFIDRGHCDIAAELCFMLPLHAVLEALGVPHEDHDKLKDISDRLLHKSGQLEDAEAAQAIVQQAALELYEYFGHLCGLRREQPADDIVTGLLNSEIDGRPMTQDEVLDMCMVLVPAGFETTASAIGYSMLFLAENPELADQLRNDPSLIPGAVEEFLRLSTPTRGICRTVKTEHDLNGHHFVAGDRINLNTVAANWDPEVFERPDELVIERKSNRHMAFGMGPHLCIGNHMARLEMRIAIEEVLSRMDNIRLADLDQVVEAPGTTWGFSSLPLVFDKAPRD
jgi:cytochrome P450